MIIMTDAGKQYRNKCFVEGKVYNPSKFVFANVPGLNPNAEPATTATIPTGYVVYEHAVTQKSKVDNDYVLFSVMMGSDIGDFYFNWIGLVAEDNDTDVLLMVKHSPLIPKQKQDLDIGQEGNSVARTFGQRFGGAAAVADVTMPPESWQYDFSTEFNQLIYGQAIALESLAAVHIKQFDFNERLKAIGA